MLNTVKPRFFLMENVARMAETEKNEITRCLHGVEPVCINSALLSAQKRRRLYWVGVLYDDGRYRQVHIPQPSDRHIYMRDILEKIQDDDPQWFPLQSECVRDFAKNRTLYQNLSHEKPIIVGNTHPSGR